MRVLGMISGTSHDGIDAAVVEFALDGDLLTGAVLHGSTTPYDPALRARLIAALPPAPTTLAEITQLDTLIGQAFADVAARAADLVGGVDLVVSHGQTVYHWVEGGHALGTLQIGQPAWIAERTGVPVLSDVRIRDITLGGHGAPLVSYLDALLLAGRVAAGETAAALNLGGIANITVVRGGNLVAYDTGPANALVDAVVVAGGLDPAGYDAGGRLAAAGTVDETLLAVLLDEPYYRLDPPRSTGKELFHLPYVDAAVARSGTRPAPADLVRTLVELTARTVADEVRRQGATFLAASGGGTHNPVLMDRIAALLPGVEVVPADTLGAPADDKEAIAFALIGWCTAHGLPGTVPAGTGARSARILGTLTPGAGPLSLPAPLASAPARLRLSDERPRP